MSFVDDESNEQTRLDGYTDGGPDGPDESHDDDELCINPDPLHDPRDNPYYDPDGSSEEDDYYHDLDWRSEENGAKKITCRKCRCQDCRPKGTVINRGERVRAFKCTRCGHRFNPNVVLAIDKLKRAAEVMDLRVCGVTLKDAVEEINRRYKAKHDVKMMRKYIKDLLKYLKIPIADILDDITYGDVWEVDETKMPLKDPAYYTGIIDRETRMPIARMLTRRKPSVEDFVELFEEARTRAGTPRVIVSDGYPSYPNAIKTVFNGKVKHIVSPRKDGKGHGWVVSIDGKKYHNMHVERFWGFIKSCFRPGVTYEDEFFEDYLEFISMRYIFIHENENLTIDGKKVTPAMAGGFIKRYDSIKNLFSDALKNPKTVRRQIEREDLEKCVAIKSDSRKLYARIKSEYMEQDDIDITYAKVDTVLSECGFALDEEQKRWESIDLVRMRQMSMRGGVRHPEMKTFEVCDFCECIALSRREVEESFVCEVVDGRLESRPTCKKCRAKPPQLVPVPDSAGVVDEPHEPLDGSIELLLELLNKGHTDVAVENWVPYMPDLQDNQSIVERSGRTYVVSIGSPEFPEDEDE